MDKDEKTMECCKDMKKCKSRNFCGGGDSSALYGLGVVGALFYFLQNASSFGMVVTGIGKSFFWPAFVIFKLLTLLRV